MNAIIENSTGKVIFYRDDSESIELTSSGLRIGGMAVPDCTDQTHSLIPVPFNADYVSGYWKIDAGQWQPVDPVAWAAYCAERDAKAAAEAAQHARLAAKAAREEAVANIKVTTQAGNTFDGDETSQTRMARAIVALQATGTPSVTWVLADNTVINATVAELAEALALAGAAQAAIWVIE